MVGSGQLYQQYQSEKEIVWQKRKAELAAIWEEQKQGIQRLASTAKLTLPKAASWHLKRKLRAQARRSANTAIAETRRSMAKKREDIKIRYKTLGYIEWLKQEAERGNIPAIYALRKRGAVAPALINITTCDLRNSKLIEDKVVHVTGRGTLFYQVGTDVFRDNGSHVSLKREVSDAGIHAALKIAMVKFDGQPLVVNGTDEFKKRCIECVVEHNLPIVFQDIQLEKQKNLLITAVKQQSDSIVRDHQNTMPNRVKTGVRNSQSRSSPKGRNR